MIQESFSFCYFPVELEDGEGGRLRVEKGLKRNLDNLPIKQLRVTSKYCHCNYSEKH